MSAWRCICIAICATACTHAVAQESVGPVVVMSVPSKSDAIWQKFADPRLPIRNIRDLQSAFPALEYVVQLHGATYYVFDKKLPALKLQIDRLAVLKAFLKNMDAKGIVRFGSLTKSEQESALALFRGSIVPMRAMGDSISDVRVALGLSVFLEASSDNKTVGAIVAAGRQGEEAAAIQKELSEHGVAAVEMTPELVDSLNKEAFEQGRANLGLSVRTLGVNPFETTTVTSRAVEVFNDYLKQEEGRNSEQYAELESKLLSRAVPEFGGSVPRHRIPRSQVPAKLWSTYESAVTKSYRAYGFKDVAEAEAFFGAAEYVNLKVEFKMTYATKPYVDSNGRQHGATGHSVVLIRR